MLENIYYQKANNILCGTHIDRTDLHVGGYVIRHTLV